MAFTAAIKSYTLDHVKANATIVFEKTITSSGSGYNNLTGVFVAPMSGLYSFSCSLLDHTGEHNVPSDDHGQANLHAEIVQNGKVLGRIFAHAEENHRDQGSVSVVTFLNQGEQVWVRNIDHDDVGIGGQLYSTFSGYLIMEI